MLQDCKHVCSVSRIRNSTLVMYIRTFSGRLITDILFDGAFLSMRLRRYSDEWQYILVTITMYVSTYISSLLNQTNCFHSSWLQPSLSYSVGFWLLKNASQCYWWGIGLKGFYIAHWQKIAWDFDLLFTIFCLQNTTIL